MSAATWATTLIPSCSLLVAAIMLALARRQTRVEERDDARDEALSLAAVRGKSIADLERRIGSLENELGEKEQKAHAEIEALTNVIETVRNEAAETQRMLIVGFRGAILKLLEHLEAEPAEVPAAIRYLREMLADDGPARFRSSTRRY